MKNLVIRDIYIIVYIQINNCIYRSQVVPKHYINLIT